MLALDDYPMVCTECSLLSNHAPSFLPKGIVPHLIWNDEFDVPELDRSKWDFRTHFWGKRLSCFADENDTDALEIKDSCIFMYLREKKGRFYSPHLQTGALLYDGPMEDKGFWPYTKRKTPNFMKKYGFFECRAKTQQCPNWWSAFWLQSPDIGATLNPEHSGVECDIMESFQPGVIIPSCMHYNGYGADYKGYKSDRKKGNIDERSVKIDNSQFHTYGCLWEPDGYTFFIDGRQKGVKVGNQTDEPVSATEQFILISTESKNFRNTGLPAENLEQSVGDAFIVDYVRVFDI